MSETPTGGVTVDTSEFEPQAQTQDVPPAQEPAQGGEAARSVEAEATTDQPLSAEELQEQLSRERSAREKAEKVVRESQSRMAKLQQENKQARERELRNVEDQIAQINTRLDQGESLTLEELRRRDTLMEQKITLRLNQRDAQEHESRRVEYGNKLQDLAMKDMGMDTTAYGEFLMRHAEPITNPHTGVVEMIPFGNYSDPEKAFNAAIAMLHYETRDQYENQVRQTADQKADELRKRQIRSALPGGTPTKPQPPPDPQESYKAAIRQAGQNQNPNDWW